MGFRGRFGRDLESRSLWFTVYHIIYNTYFSHFLSTLPPKIILQEEIKYMAIEWFTTTKKQVIIDTLPFVMSRFISFNVTTLNKIIGSKVRKIIHVYYYIQKSINQVIQSEGGKVSLEELDTYKTLQKKVHNEREELINSKCGWGYS